MKLSDGHIRELEASVKARLLQGLYWTSDRSLRTQVRETLERCRPVRRDVFCPMSSGGVGAGLTASLAGSATSTAGSG